jgi:crotonobetainyl-CoA:carnitine CoA-transferase CaiB-like acyl-CoA transferase
MITSWNHPVEPNLRLMASPLKLSETPVRTDLPPPLLGQHTDEVLTQVLGYSAAQLAQMRGQGVI